EGRGLAGVEELELGAVEIEAQQLRRRARPASRQDVNVIEDPEDIGQPEEQDEQEQRSQIEELDVAKLCPPAGPVDLGSLHRLPGNGLQSGEQDEVDERRPLPDVDTGD